MARVENTVFISYRRSDVYTALAVYENLKNQGYNVFFDYRSISSGDFEQIITSNIKARAHFVLILTPTALDRCNEPGDWLRREIEIAIDEKRNIIPLFFNGFRFGTPSVTAKLTGKLKNLSRYNGLNVHEDYFDEAMDRLRSQYLNIPLDTVLHPLSTEVQKAVREEQVAADKALEQIENVKELVKHPEIKANPPAKPEAKPKISVPHKAEESPIPNSRFNFPLIGGMAGGLLILGLLIWGTSNFLRNIPNATPAATTVFPTDMTFTIPETSSDTPTPTPTYTPTSTSTPDLVSVMIANKDAMTLLYVAGGEFILGNSAEDAFAKCQKFRPVCQLNWFQNEQPSQVINLDAFWIDKTEVTNAMYRRCVGAGKCGPPNSNQSATRDSYYGNSEFDNYPVIYVSWTDAKNYCEWAERRLPTEAEWEKAASWNSEQEEKYVFPWGDSINCSFANYNGTDSDCNKDTAPVETYPTGHSPYGALNMAGNVWEWVSTLYGPYPYAPNENRENPSDSGARILRGGAWSNIDASLRSANRVKADATAFSNDIGFRCAVSATQ